MKIIALSVPGPTPDSRKMNELESKVREFCARSLDPIAGTGRFDFIADLGELGIIQVPRIARKASQDNLWFFF